MATLGSGNAPSSLARRLAAGHADKDVHDADEWRKWRRDRILAARDRRGRLRRIDYCDVSPKAAKIIDRMRVPDRAGRLAQFLNRIVTEWAGRSGIK